VKDPAFCKFATFSGGETKRMTGNFRGVSPWTGKADKFKAFVFDTDIFFLLFGHGLTLQYRIFKYFSLNLVGQNLFPFPEIGEYFCRPVPSRAVQCITFGDADLVSYFYQCVLRFGCHFLSPFFIFFFQDLDTKPAALTFKVFHF
jgi:hypothetical protein